MQFIEVDIRSAIQNNVNDTVTSEDMKNTLLRRDVRDSMRGVCSRTRVYLTERCMYKIIYFR